MVEDPTTDDSAPAESTPPADGPPDSRYGHPLTVARGQQVIHPDREGWRRLASDLLADGWNMCVDLTAVDHLTNRSARPLPTSVAPERFELVANFLSHERRERIRARCQVPESDPTVDSLYSIFPGVDAMEREVYDLMGITFTDHPDLSRILMPEHWEGHPLRKDFATGAIPVQFKGAPAAR